MVPSPRHAPTSSTSSPSASATLPARFTVPPMPPQIHRRLTLSLGTNGVILRPKSSDKEPKGPKSSNVAGGVLVNWGVKGKVELFDGEAEDGKSVDLGGILGIVRLWDAAYILVFLPPVKPPSPLFPNHVEAALPEDDAALGREAAASSHEVYTLGDIHPIPLVPALAEKAFQHLQSIQVKRAPKKSAARGLNLKWGLPSIYIGGPGTVSTEELKRLSQSSDDESETDGEGDDPAFDTKATNTIPTTSRESLAPEADDSPTDLLPPSTSTTSPKQGDDAGRKRFSLGWGRFMPKLGKAAVKKEEGVAEVSVETAPLSHQSEDIPDPVAVEEPIPKAETREMVPTEEQKAEAEASSAPVPEASVDSANPPALPPFASNPPQRRDLETKILREIIREYSSGGFFYSFDFDLTHSLQHKRNLLTSRSTSGTLLANLLTKENRSRTTFPDDDSAPSTPLETAGPSAGLAPSHMKGPSMATEDDFVEPDVQVPLWRRVDRRFWWNEALMKDFLELGLHAYVLPVMQGWVQSSSFAIPVPPNPLEPGVSLGEVPVDLVVISRRSRERAGLRYQRRGIDDEGHVANMVETEMIVRAKVEGKVSLFSFVQVRGSIPLKWSQSPYSLKPPPILDQPVDQSYSVANLHFDDLKKRYGPITIVNLSEQTGKEAIVTNGYKELVESLNRKDLTYKDFDFHAKCHGMKWENISELVEQLDFGSMGYLWTLQGDAIREQSGAFRTNCIDCLDRTNVVQSALARNVLSAMLTQLGLITDSNTSSIESVFNDTWANNGDMLSFCYAHTSALKGDFVRTGKRDLSGMLHDGVSSISRMFYGAVSDFFAQAVISFLLGHRNLGVFSEFLETLQSSDASSLIKLSRVRLAAVDTCSARVLSDGEVRVAGWTLLSPEQRNVKLSPKLEEKVLLLTKVAIYVVSFNYALEKVIGFTRIPLASITSIQKGAYILSPLQEASRDPAENAGFIINFSPANESTRYSTYSFRNRLPSSSAPSSAANTPSFFSQPTMPPLDPSTQHIPTTPTTPIPDVQLSTVDPAVSEFFAFKALPREFVARGASSFSAGRGGGDEEDDDDLGNMADGDHGTGESCRAVVDRLVERVREQCVRAGSGTGEDFVMEKDVVSLAEAQSSTSILARVDYAFKRFLWL